MSDFNVLVAQHARHYVVREEIVQACLTAIRNKAAAQWTPEQIAEWFHSTVGPDTPYSRPEIVQDTLAALAALA